MLLVPPSRCCRQMSHVTIFVPPQMRSGSYSSTISKPTTSEYRAFVLPSSMNRYWPCLAYAPLYESASTVISLSDPFGALTMSLCHAICPPIAKLAIDSESVCYPKNPSSILPFSDVFNRGAPQLKKQLWVRDGAANAARAKLAL